MSKTSYSALVEAAQAASLGLVDHIEDNTEISLICIVDDELDADVKRQCKDKPLSGGFVINLADGQRVIVISIMLSGGSLLKTARLAQLKPTTAKVTSMIDVVYAVSCDDVEFDVE